MSTTISSINFGIFENDDGLCDGESGTDVTPENMDRPPLTTKEKDDLSEHCSSQLSGEGGKKQHAALAGYSIFMATHKQFNAII